MNKAIESINEKLDSILKSVFFQSLLVFIFCIPLIATLGQYIYSGFILQNSNVAILFWPGIDKEIAVNIPVLLSFGAISITYLGGIVYMFRRKTFGKVAFYGFLGMILAQSLEALVNSIFGLRELQNITSDSASGVVNQMIFAQWHNPIWEELVFRGLPLVLLIIFKNKLSGKAYKASVILYFGISSVAMALYHIPNHGISRIVDTLILSGVFAFLTLRYSLFSAIVFHCLIDAMMIPNFGTMKGIPVNEVAWLSQNYTLLNTSFAMGIVLLLISLPVIFLWNARKSTNYKKNRKRTYAIAIVSLVILCAILSRFVS